jgi:hypothetical protein
VCRQAIRALRNRIELPRRTLIEQADAVYT